MKLSFCITYKNRFAQIVKTLPKNISDNINLNTEIEFILVDFNSNDGLFEWIKSNFMNHIQSGYLKYYYSEELPYWECSKAKNRSHQLGSGKILVNLDCDNYTGKNGGQFVLKQFRNYGSNTILHQASGISKDGSYGRISVLKTYFQMIGGYDESFSPMGYQDYDLIKRLKEFGLIYVCENSNAYNKAIKNSKDEGLKFTNTDQSYSEMLNNNIKISNYNIFNGNLKTDNPENKKSNIFRLHNDGKLLRIEEPDQ